MDADVARKRSISSEKYAAPTYRSYTTVMNWHPFELRKIVNTDIVPVSEDENRMRRPALSRWPCGTGVGGGLRVGAEDGEQRGKGKKQKTRKVRKVRWSNAVDGEGGRKESLFE